MGMTLVETITQDLHRIPDAKLVEVARLVRELVPEAIQRQREGLKAVHGCMDEKTAKVFEEALAGARQVSENPSDG